jgi:hypothetical protein
VHRFTPIQEDDAEILGRSVVKRHVPKSDPRHEWASLIWQTYHGDTIHPITLCHANYPEDLRAAMQDEEARIQAQFSDATPEAIEESNREQIVLESLEAHEDLRELPDFPKEIQERRRQLLTIIRMETSERIASECREHIRRMNHIWKSTTKEQKDTYDEWHTKDIREKGLSATLIDLISSLEARRIPVTFFGCPICRENEDDYHASSSKSFHDHCKRLHGCSDFEARDATVSILNQVRKCEIAMKPFGEMGNGVSCDLLCRCATCRIVLTTPSIREYF